MFGEVVAPLTPEQISDANTMELAFQLHKMPHEIEQLSYRDYCKLVAFLDYKQTVQELKANKLS